MKLLNGKKKKSDAAENKKTKIQSNYCENFFIRWDRIIGPALLILVLVMLILAVVLNTMETSNSTDIIQFHSTNLSRTGASNNFKPKCVVQQCMEGLINCTGIAEDENIVEHLNYVMNQNRSCLTLSIKLHIYKCDFIDSTIYQGWLNGWEVTSLVEVTIEESPITHINDSAFSGPPFSTLTSLTLTETNIQFLNKNSFIGLSSLTTFVFTNNDNKPITVEAQVLNGMKQSLTILQFNRCLNDPEAIHNLTGENGVMLTQLQLIDFGYNTLQEITGYSFQKCPIVRSLFLLGNSLENVDKNAFKGTNSFQLINLESNALTSLEEGVFNTFNFNNGSLSLGNNPWICDCKLKWLKDMYLNTNYLDQDPRPLCDNEHDFGEEDFECFSTTTGTSTISTTSSTTDSTTETTTDSTSSTTTEFPLPVEDLIPINCRDVSLSPIVVDRDVSREIINTIRIDVQNRSLTFDFYELDQDPLIIEIKITGNIQGFHVLWFETKNTTNYGCVTAVQTVIFMTGLKRDKTYTICLMYDSKVNVSPFDCMGLQTRPLWKFRTWISNEYTGAFIGGIIGMLIGTILVTVTTVCCCIWYYPSLFKNNKRIVIVKRIKKSDDASQIPAVEILHAPTYMDPSYMSAGYYLTPVQHPPYNRLRFHSVPIPENEVLSGGDFYMPGRPFVPYTFHTLMGNQQEAAGRVVDGSTVVVPRAAPDSTQSEEIPPPLPPPNRNSSIYVHKNEPSTSNDNHIYNSVLKM